MALSRYESLRRTFESRLASLAHVVRLAGGVVGDELVQQLDASDETKMFAPVHARELIKRYQTAERDEYLHDLALKLADAEATIYLLSRRNETLSSSLSMLREDSARGERFRTEVAGVNAEVHDLRLEYQVRHKLPFSTPTILYEVVIGKS